MASISNQYAAMPSLHIGWSTWCAIALWPLLRRRWTKVLVLLYPATTLFCIVVTANHYWLDGIGGLVAFSIGALIGWGVAPVEPGTPRSAVRRRASTEHFVTVPRMNGRLVVSLTPQ